MKSSLLRVALAVFLLCSLVTAAAVALKADRGLLDFGAFYMAAVAEEAGRDPYGVHPDLAAATGRHFGHEDARGHSPNLNPPVSLYAFRPLAGGEPEAVKLALNLASGLLFAACAAVLVTRYPQHRNPQGLLWLAALGGFWYTLWLGQVYVLLFAIGLGAWFGVQRGAHPLLAGLLIGVLVAVKPHLALWPLFLLLAGHPRIALTALAAAAGSSAIPLLLEGPAIYGRWLEAVEAYPRIALAGNASLAGQAARLGFVEAGYALSAALVAATAWLLWRARPAAGRASAWAITVALLASPIAWVGYGLLLVPVLMSRQWHAAEWLAALGMTGLWFALGIGEPFLAASLLVLYLLARDQLVCRDLSRGVEAARRAGPSRRYAGAAAMSAEGAAPSRS